MKEKIIQFGAGNFLRAFADYFIDKLNKDNLFDGKVVIVSPTNSKTVEKINSQQGKYNLYIRGISDNKEICNRIQIDSISRAINPYMDFDSYISLAHNQDFRYIISNTTEAGIIFSQDDKFNDRPAKSFPAKLTQLLFERYKLNLDGFIIFACELIDNNADVLKECVLKYADLWQLGDDFTKWICNNNHFCNTLVDRIVTGYPKDEAQSLCEEIGFDDKLLDTAEPYHLWAIEGDFENELPLKKAGLNVIWTDDIKPYKKMKVRILNGCHTSLVFASLLCGISTVKQSLDDDDLHKFLNLCMFDYILPTLGDTEENRAFANAVFERFANPYIKHMWKSISLNSVSKFNARVLPTIIDYINKNNAVPKPLAFSLACLIEYYKNNEVNDSENAVNYIREHNIENILSNTDIWDYDLSMLAEIVNESLIKIHKEGIREALRWAMS